MYLISAIIVINFVKLKGRLENVLKLKWLHCGIYLIFYGRCAFFRAQLIRLASVILLKSIQIFYPSLRVD